MLNNKGQSLTMFVLILPIIVLVFLGIIDVGRMTSLRMELDDINYLAIDYGLDIMEDDEVVDKIKEITFKNKSDIDQIDVKIEEEKIYVEINKNVDLMLIKNRNIFSVTSKYVGYNQEGKKIIERDK